MPLLIPLPRPFPKYNCLLGTCSVIPQIQYPGEHLAKCQEKCSHLEVERELGNRSGIIHFSCPFTSRFLNQVLTFLRPPGGKPAKALPDPSDKLRIHQRQTQRQVAL